MKIDFSFSQLSGIYLITNVVSGNKYVGSSRNIYDRAHSHRTKLVKGKHENIILQNAVTKHGIDNFTFTLIELCSEDSLLEREQYWIDKMNPKYNITRNVIRNVLSDSSRILISNTLKTKYIDGMPLQNNKQIYAYDWNGRLINKYESMTKASIALGCSLDSVSRVANGELPRFRKYYFSFEIEDPKIFSPKWILIDLEDQVYYKTDNLTKLCNTIGIKIKCLTNWTQKKTRVYLDRYVVKRIRAPYNWVNCWDVWKQIISSQVELGLEEFGRFRDYEGEPNNNPSHERPTPILVGDEIVQAACITNEDAESIG